MSSGLPQTWEDKAWAIVDEVIDFLHDPSAPTPLWDACTEVERWALERTMKVVGVLVEDATKRTAASLLHIHHAHWSPQHAQHAQFPYGDNTPTRDDCLQRIEQLGLPFDQPAASHQPKG